MAVTGGLTFVRLCTLGREGGGDVSFGDKLKFVLFLAGPLIAAAVAIWLVFG